MCGVAVIVVCCLMLVVGWLVGWVRFVLAIVVVVVVADVDIALLVSA